jgi:chorismate dehydratase
MLAEADAALLIGDPAMTFPRTNDLRIYDLAEVWRAATGLGFVFALWMAREGESEEKARAVRWSEARDEGLAHADEIVRIYEGTLGLDRTELRTYLLESICYQLDDEMLAGLDLFYHLAHKHKIIKKVRPLKFLA